MDILVIGDVHGCYYTLKKLIDDNWDYKRDMLIQLGDIIDRGNFTPETVRYCMELKEKYDDRAVFLKGNHEFEMIEHFYNGPNKNWLRQCGEATLKQYRKQEVNIEEHIKWFSKMSLYWENESVFISHAGISKTCLTPICETESNGVLWNRSELKNIEKLQIIGHTPCENNKAIFDDKTNCWNIDTGAGYDGNLTAINIKETGEVLEIITMKTLACEFYGPSEERN
jgi:serine/threonine protein phosphatase 1